MIYPLKNKLGSFLGTFDDQTGQLIEVPIGDRVKGIRKWHHVAVTVENNAEQE